MPETVTGEPVTVNRGGGQRQADGSHRAAGARAAGARGAAVDEVAAGVDRHAVPVDESAADSAEFGRRAAVSEREVGDGQDAGDGRASERQGREVRVDASAAGQEREANGADRGRVEHAGPLADEHGVGGEGGAAGAAVRDGERAGDVGRQGYGGEGTRASRVAVINRRRRAERAERRGGLSAAAEDNLMEDERRRRRGTGRAGDGARRRDRSAGNRRRRVDFRHGAAAPAAPADARSCRPAS